MRAMLTRVAAGVIAGIVAGVLSGAAARIAMRSVALGIPGDGSMQVPLFTPQGTAAILVSGAIVGAPFGALFALLYEALPGPRRFRGLLFAAILLVAMGPLFFVGAADEFTSTGRVILFALLFPVFGAAVGLALPVGQRLAAALARPARVVLVVAAAGCALFVAAGIIGLASGSIEQRGPMALALFASWVVLAIPAWAARRRSRSALVAAPTEA